MDGGNRDSGGNLVTSVLTDSHGNYSIANVGPGSWTVDQIVKPNWVQTQPFFPTTYFLAAQSGQNVSGLVLGDHASPALAVYAAIDNGQPGYSETGTWTTSPGGFNGANRVTPRCTVGPRRPLPRGRSLACPAPTPTTSM